MAKEHTEEPDAKNAANSAIGRVWKFARDSAWQFVGAVVGILALLVALAQLTADDKKDEVSPPALEIYGNVEGNCSAVGTGIAIDC